MLFLIFWKPPGEIVAGFFFYVFGVGAIIGGVLTITSRNPVYSALWFALVVIATAGLFLLAGASFLAAGTIIVYAGAIIVTFLFVIMLAQMEGKATLRPGGPVAGPGDLRVLPALVVLDLFAFGDCVQSGERLAQIRDRLAAKNRSAESAGVRDGLSTSKTGAIDGVVDRALPPTNMIRNSANRKAQRRGAG